MLQDIPSQIAPVYADSYWYRGVIPIEVAEDILGDLSDVAKFYFGDKRSCVTYCISESRVRRALDALHLDVYADRLPCQEFNSLLCVADKLKSWKLEKAVMERITHKEMMADFEGRAIDERLLTLLSHAKPVKWGLFHHLHTASYVRGRVALVGDSAHASLPLQAAGAAQGLEDAYVLGTLIAEAHHGNKTRQSSSSRIRAALVGYDRVRRPRAQKQLESAAEMADFSFFQQPETGSDVTKMWPRMQKGRFDWLWLHDLEKDTRDAKHDLDGIDGE